MQRYLKAIVAIAGAVLTTVLAQFPDSSVVQQWGPIAAAFLTAVSVYFVPNAANPGADSDRDDSALDEDVTPEVVNDADTTPPAAA